MNDTQKGTVIVNEITFDWRMTGCDNATVTVENPVYGTTSEFIGSIGPEILARVLAKELIAKIYR